MIFSPPVLICRGGIEYGIDDNPIEQAYTSNLLNRHFHKPSSFDYYYFLNLKFWQDLNIKQLDIIKSKSHEAIPEKINPFLYRIDQNLPDHSFNFFEVTRGDDEWYYSYYVQGG